MGFGRRWPKLWAFFVAFALVGHLGFLAHQNDHHRRFELSGSDDCAMCQFGASMAAGPAPQPLLVPRASPIDTVVRCPGDTTAPRVFAAAAFRSRAPPALSFA